MEALRCSFVQKQPPMGPLPYLLAGTLLLASCRSKAPEEETPAVVPPAVPEQEAPTVIGLYADTLSCADCPGILTQLDLRADSTFVLMEHYLERDSIPNGTIGKWHVSGNDLVLGKNEVWRQVPQGLERLGADRRPVDTSLPNRIRRVANFGSSPMHLMGGYVYYADAHGFTPCGSGYSIPVAMDEAGTQGASLELERLYGKKVKHAPDPLYVRIIGTLRTGPAMEGDGTEEYLHIDRLEGEMGGRTCP